MASAQILASLWIVTAAAFVLVAAVPPLHVQAGQLLAGLGLDPQPHRSGLHALLFTRFAGNVRIALLPDLLVAFGATRRSARRVLGDLIVAGTLAANAALVGAALAVVGPRLLAYLPHLPLEWAGLACCAAPWLLARSRMPAARTMIGLCGVGVALLALAAVAETYLTPSLHA